MISAEKVLKPSVPSLECRGIGVPLNASSPAWLTSRRFSGLPMEPQMDCSIPCSPSSCPCVSALPILYR